ncbi:MAG: hypothetical protein ACRDTG_28005 [Pseudonocardiaceae bacterium]
MRATQDEMVPLHVPFEIVLRGFDRRQVLDHIESLEGRIAMIAADRDAALQQTADLSKLLEHLRCEVEEANTRVERLQRSSLGAAGARIQRMLQMAEDEITALQAATEQETTSLRERTHAEADRLMQETILRCERLEAESEQRRSTEEAESAARCRRAEEDSARRRLAAEQQCERDILRKEAQAAAWITEYQTWGVAGLHLMLRIAGEGLSKRMAEVEREIARFTELRADVTARLSSAHRVLVDAVAQVERPTAIERGGAIEPGEAMADQAGRGAGLLDG